MSLETTTSSRRSSRMLARPGVVGDHDLARLDGAAAGLDPHPAAVDPPDDGVLVDADPLLERDAPQPADERGGLHGGRRALEHAGQVLRRSRAPGDLVRRQALERVGAQPLRQLHGALPGTELGIRARRPEPAAGPVVAVDAVGACELSELGHGVRGLAADLQRSGLAGQLDQRRELGPPGQGEPAVATRCAAAADVGLEHHDVEVGGRLLEAKRRPQADVPAADDRHVGARRPLERRGVLAAGQRLLEPQRAVRLVVRPVAHPRSMTPAGHRCAAGRDSAICNGFAKNRSCVFSPGDGGRLPV